MKLYLSSFRMGERFGELVGALPAGASVAVISNAVDFVSAESRAAYARRGFDPVDQFSAAGLQARDVDLRAYFGRPAELEEALADDRLIWATGGNSFLLRRAMRQSGLDELVRKRLAAGDVIYGGWSAGAVVAGPTLRGIHLMDDPRVIADGYEPEPIWEGLGFVEDVLVPHFQSDHPEAATAQEAVDWLGREGLPYRTLRDGEVLIF
jgi:dipeptidase E